jgi:hypothetical protein
VGSNFVSTTTSWPADRRILLAVIAGLLVGFLPVLFLQVEPVAATVRPGFEDRLVESLGGRPMALASTRRT